jgi:NAD(P)-dependent dehydrogenase (short-subunit alcohol dehydrogenase family)
MSTSGKAEALAKELGGLGLTGSVTEESDLEALVSETLDRYGRIDGVVNSTGHPASGEILDLTDEQWHDALDLVVLNVVRIARLVPPPCAPAWPASRSSTPTATQQRASG